jgi:heterodisulfide reductase subunit C2
LEDSVALRPDDGEFLAEVEKRSGVRVSSCFHCGKCTNGCPIAYAMDLAPNLVIRHIQLGQRDRVLSSETLWLCASCVTCSTRCPNDIDLAHVMDTLRRMSVGRGRVALPKVASFHKGFLEAIATHGRVHEIEMILRYKLASRTFLDDADLGKEMLKRGRIRFIPERIRGRKQVKEILQGAPSER